MYPGFFFFFFVNLLGFYEIITLSEKFKHDKMVAEKVVNFSQKEITSFANRSLDKILDFKCQSFKNMKFTRHSQEMVEFFNQNLLPMTFFWMISKFWGQISITCPIIQVLIRAYSPLQYLFLICDLQNLENSMKMRVIAMFR